MSGYTVVYEVLLDTDAPGPAADGTVVRRFRRWMDAFRVAEGATCYGRPATVETRSVPMALAQRWGLA